MQKKKMTLDTQDSIYIALIDHIQASIERYKEGTFIRNKILWEIKIFIVKSLILVFMA